MVEIKVTTVWLKGAKSPVIIGSAESWKSVKAVALGAPSGFAEEILQMTPDPPQPGEELYVCSRRIGSPEGIWREGVWGTVECVEIEKVGSRPSDQPTDELSDVEIDLALEAAGKPLHLGC